MSHKESDTIYNGIQNLPQLKLMASVIAKGKPIKAKQAEDDHDAAVEKIAKQAERDRAADELGAPMNIKDSYNTKLGLDSVQTRFSKFTSLLTSHLANSQKDS